MELLYQPQAGKNFKKPMRNEDLPIWQRMGHVGEDQSDFLGTKWIPYPHHFQQCKG
jgi:hypothetical protein